MVREPNSRWARRYGVRGKKPGTRLPTRADDRPTAAKNPSDGLPSDPCCRPWMTTATRTQPKTAAPAHHDEPRRRARHCRKCDSAAGGPTTSPESRRWRCRHGTSRASWSRPPFHVVSVLWRGRGSYSVCDACPRGGLARHYEKTHVHLFGRAHCIIVSGTEKAVIVTAAVKGKVSINWIPFRYAGLDQKPPFVVWRFIRLYSVSFWTHLVSMCVRARARVCVRASVFLKKLSLDDKKIFFQNK